jgi:hypothetical protein
VVEKYYAGVYWMSRQESAEACARRAEAYFRLLAPLDPTWTHWFGKANTLQEALKLRIDPVAPTLQALFEQKAHRLLEDGYALGLWNGEQFADATRTDLACGTSSRSVSNACVLNPPIPARSIVGERIVNAHTMSQVVRAMALAWEPDWGVAMSNAYLDMVTPGQLPPVLVGWVTYLSRRRGTVPPLPEPVRIEPVEELGTLITLTPERFTANNPAHVALSQQVRERLEHAGLLVPQGPRE